MVLALAIRSLAAHGDVTLSQFRALDALRAVGPHTMGALAEQLGCSPSAATRLCDRLVRTGLVVRAAGRSRREVVVAVTTAGTALVETVARHRRGELARIVSRMPSPARAAMLDGLSAFIAAAGELPANAWSLGPAG